MLSPPPLSVASLYLTLTELLHACRLYMTQSSSGIGKLKTNCRTMYHNTVWQVLDLRCLNAQKQGSGQMHKWLAMPVGWRKASQPVQLPHKVWMRVTKSHRASRNYSVLMVAKEKKSLRTQQQLHRPNSPLQRKGELDLTAKRYICVHLNKEITNPENSCLI